MVGNNRGYAARWLLALPLGAALVTALPAKDSKGPRPNIRIGMVSSLFKNMPAPMAKACTGPFRALMESQTGLHGMIVLGGDAYELAAKLTSNELQLGVFHGIEFAWAQQRYPALRPLMIAINQQRHLHAYVMVKKDSDAKNITRLIGKRLAVPFETRDHCTLFLERCCQAQGKPPARFFSKTTTPDNSEAALDDVAAGRVDAALVDGVALKCYKRRNPQRYARLKVVEKSCCFPAAVVAYHAGAVDRATLQRFKTGMLNANKTSYGRQLLTLGRMTGFEPVPNDYKKILTEVAQTYPPPNTFKVSAKDQSGSR
jgi:ABC-type phosphate/phosphonate transport system substrate-binding protein